jgi:hypothetical protein
LPASNESFLNLAVLLAIMSSMCKFSKKIVMLKEALMIFALAGSVLGQDTIVYFSGPSFPFPSYEQTGGGSLDFNEDGSPDFSFAFGVFLCTTDVPISGCTLPYYVTAEGTNGILRQFNQIAILPLGELSGAHRPPIPHGAVRIHTQQWPISLAVRVISQMRGPVL